PSSNDFGSHVARTSCRSHEVCIDHGRGRVGCVVDPPTRCDRRTFRGRCQDGDTVFCGRPIDGFLTGSYVVHHEMCADEQLGCEMIEAAPTCWGPTPPCPLPAGQSPGCVGTAIVYCGPGPHGSRVETTRTDCAPGGHCEIADAGSIGCSQYMR